MRSARRLQRLTPRTPDAVALAAALASRALAFGHSRVPLERVAELLAEIAPERAPPLPERGEWEQQLRESAYVSADGASGRPLVFASGGIALRRYHEYEVELAGALRALSGPVAPAPDDEWLRARIAALFPAEAKVPDRQALAAALGQIERVVLLTGGPGTGKTTTVARVLVLAVEAAQRRGETLRVALAAPTGKAAARLSEALRESYAQLLAQGRIDATLRDALPQRSEHAASPPRRPARFGAFPARRDESARGRSRRRRRSIDGRPAADVQARPGADAVGARLILLGDRDQLPSVETGDVLAALCDAAGDGTAWPNRARAAARRGARRRGCACARTKPC